MLVGSVGSRGRDGLRVAFRVMAMAGMIAMGGCNTLNAINPINLYRDMTGASKGDPGPDEANSANLEAGSKEPFPKVGSVPDVPTRGLTKAQRESLAEGLVSDRDNARYTDLQIRGGNASAVMPAQVPVPEEQLPYVAPPPADTAAAPVAQPRSTGRLVAGGAFGSRPTAPVAADRESSLQAPPPRANPEPETPRAPPGPPDLKPVPPPQAPQPFPGAPPARPEDASQPAQVAGVPVPGAPPSRAQPVPAAPDFAPVPATAVANAGKHTKSAQVAEVNFTAGSTALVAGAAGQLDAVPALHRQYGGAVRVVGYASVPAGGADPAGQQLAAYQAAIERANLVKQALVNAGVPAAEIVTEASPVHGNGNAADRADIYVEY
jgi:outer membrane protein OmpA-like peptidoglycan-associated protein